MNNLKFYSLARLYLLLFLLSNILLGCSPNLNDYILDDGIYFEKQPEGNEDYDSDNEIYTIGRTYVFDYYILKGKDTLKFKETPLIGEWPYSIESSPEAWEFTKLKTGDSVVNQLFIRPIKYDSLPRNQINPKQSVAEFGYLSSTGKMDFTTFTGIVENKMNVWLHPHRTKYFRILEINPFPFIQYPYEVGHEWEWELKIGWHWGDSRWKRWQGNLENKFSYKIIDKVELITPLGELETYVVDAIAVSDEGTSSLRSYFNPKYGFVKLDYTNIDASKTIIELIDVKGL